MGLSATRIQQIELKAFRKLRHKSRAKVLVQYLDHPESAMYW